MRQPLYAVFILIPRIGLAGLTVAAATEHNNYSKDYDPGAVIIKEMA